MSIFQLRRKTKRLLIEFCIALAAICILACFLIPKFLAAQNINTPEHFPDPQFRMAIEKIMGVEKGGYISASRIRSKRGTLIFEPYKGIRSVQGIEHFKSIQFLQIGWNKLITLDLSMNKKLEEIHCNNTFSFLRLPKTKTLHFINCVDCNLSSIDLSGLPSLKTLRCGKNKLTSLDVRQNPELEELWFAENSLTALDVSNNPKLRKLWGNSNLLTSIDLSNNPLLSELNLRDNQLIHLDVSKNSLLTVLDIGSNQLPSIDLSRNSALTAFHCYNNLFQSMDVSQSPRLNELFCGNKRLKKLIVSSQAPLKKLTGTYKVQVVRTGG